MATTAIVAEPHAFAGIAETKFGSQAHQASAAEMVPLRSLTMPGLALRKQNQHTVAAGYPLMTSPVAQSQASPLMAQMKPQFAQPQPNYFQVCLPQGPQGFPAARILTASDCPLLAR